MDRHEDAITVESHTYDDATPRSHRRRRTVLSESVDNLRIGESSTAKKRGYPEHHHLYNENGSKRHRSAHWPLPPDGPEEHSSRSQRHVSSPTRVSRFQEASMNDKPSEKPPSAFTRHFDAHVSASVDELMDDYHKRNDKPLPARPNSKTLPRGYGSKSPQKQTLAHAQDANQPKHDNAPTLPETMEAEAKKGGIFKFGKTMASVFNPVSVWSKMTTGWRATKEESADEVLEAHRLDQKKQAEQAYAELKQAGKLGSQGTHMISDSSTVFSPGYTSPVKEASNRDSGISGMDTDSRASVGTFQSSFLLPPEVSPRKAHHRTPSFHDLKKMASDFSLHRRSRSRSPEKQEHGGMRRSISRGNLFELFNGGVSSSDVNTSVHSTSKMSLFDVADGGEVLGSMRHKKEASKQAKLTKRVSDLESKLNTARRELDKALGQPPPIPVFSPPFAPRPLPPRPHNHGRQSSSNTRSYAQVLPTVLSESLLVEPRLDQGVETQTLATMDVLHSDDGPADDVPMEDKSLREANDNSFYMQPNQVLLKEKTETSPPAKENVPGTPESVVSIVVKAAKGTIKEEDKSHEPESFLADPSSSPAHMIVSSTPKKPTKASPPRKKTPAKKKRTSLEDKSFRPGKDSDEEGSDIDGPKRKTLKKKTKRGSDSSPRTSRLPVATKSSPKTKSKKNVLTKAPPLHKDLPPLPAIDPRSSLDVVYEESTAGPATSPSTKPTEKTSNHRSASRSPSPKKRRARITPKPEREARSPSPPPSSTLGQHAPASVERVVTARPNGRDVPPMPLPMPGSGFEEFLAKEKGVRREREGSFEWPDDVF